MVRKTKLMPIASVSILVVALAGILFILNKSPRPQDPKKRYNVVVIVSDALRSDALGCYGGEADTPHIDWLAKNGTQFLNAYSTSPWTAPSSVSLLTGYYASIFEIGKREIVTEVSRHFKPSYFVPDSIRLLPEALAEVGYEVAFQQKNPNAVVSNNFQGFTMLERLPRTEHKRIEETLKINDPYVQGGKSVFPLVDFILKKRSRPFFCLLWTADPHSPYDPVEKFHGRIAVDPSQLPRDLEYYSSHSNFHTWEHETIADAERRYIKELYLAEVESVDERVGYIIEALRYMNILENTYVVFTSDHGEAFGEHGDYSHATSFYETLIRVPLIYFGPDVQKNHIVTTAVSNISLMPTLKELLGVSYAESSLGRSYVRLLQGKFMKQRKLYFDGIQSYAYLKKEFIDAVIIDHYKLITFKPNGFELYDLDKDPNELESLAAESSGIVREMFRDISRMRDENKLIQNRYFEPSDLNKTEVVSDREVIEKLRALGYIK